MFNTFAYAFVDAVQNSKKTLVDTFVPNEHLKKTLHSFVDAQTDYTKSAIEAHNSAATSIGNSMMNKEFWNEIIKSANSFNFLKGK